MEAWLFGFDLPPAYKFDPTDADIVAHYLLPRSAGIPDPPYAHAVIDDDPCSCPPWELLRRHGHAGSDQAFFVGPPPSGGPSLNGGRACRAVRGPGGGVWRGQKGEETDLVVSRAVLWRVRITHRAKKERKKKQQAATAAKKAAPGQDRPDPSSCRVGDRAAGNAAAAAAAKKDARGPDRPGPTSTNDRTAGSAAAVASDGEGTSSGAQSDVVHQGDDGDNGGGGVVGKTTGGCYYTDLLNTVEGGGYYADDSNNYFNAVQSGPSGSHLVYGHAAGNAAAPNDGGAGTSGAQSDVVHQGSDVDGGCGVVGGTTGGYYTNFFNAGERHGCYVNDCYFNRGGGSGGDIILPAKLEC